MGFLFMGVCEQGLLFFFFNTFELALLMREKKKRTNCIGVFSSPSFFFSSVVLVYLGGSGSGSGKALHVWFAGLFLASLGVRKKKKLKRVYGRLSRRVGLAFSWPTTTSALILAMGSEREGSHQRRGWLVFGKTLGSNRVVFRRFED